MLKNYVGRKPQAFCEMSLDSVQFFWSHLTMYISPILVLDSVVRSGTHVMYLLEYSSETKTPNRI